MALEQYDMAFMDGLGADASLVLSDDEQRILGLARAALDSADAVVIHIGGKAGRLGEAIIGTAFLEGTLHTLAAVGKRQAPVTVLVDDSIAEIIPEEEYRARFWPEITIVAAIPEAVDRLGLVSYASASASAILALDFHGAHDGMPSLVREPTMTGGQTTTLASLTRVALRSYAARGSEERYAAFFRDLLLLPAESLEGDAVQPRIYLPADDDARYSELARAFGLEPDALLIVCFFQSVVAAKCYERWDEVLALIAAQVDCRFPGRRIVFLVACGPDTAQPVHQEDLAAILGGFTGSQGNARVVVATTPSLRDLAALVRSATLALSNDTGPGHLAGALGVPTITPYLPGALYSRQIWASSRWHVGVTIEPNPYRFADLQAEVFAGRTDIINTIPPESLAAEALACLSILPD